MHIFADPEFWVLVAAVIFVAVVWKPARKSLIGSLDERAARIRAELDDARKLREEAEQLLAQYQQKEREAAALTTLVERQQPVLRCNRAGQRLPPPRIRRVAVQQYNRARRIPIPFQVMEPRRAFEEVAVRGSHLNSLTNIRITSIRAVGLSSIT